MRAAQRRLPAGALKEGGEERNRETKSFKQQRHSRRRDIGAHNGALGDAH